MLGALVAELSDLDLAEDAFQDALASALEHWPRDGLPRRPGAWLLVAARRKALDRLRRAATRAAKQGEIALESQVVAPAPAPETQASDAEEIPDERLRLMFTCCHPVLSRPAQVALTLRTLGGLSTAEIARAFLVDESAMARRLVRAKAKLRQERVPYREPSADALPERRDAVLEALYLIFNEGYAATTGDALVRRELCGEAIRLARVLARLLPADAESAGVLALMLLVDSRRDARVAPDGAAVALEDQDRSRWDRRQIAEAHALLGRLGHAHAAGPYQLQARIAALHVSAVRFAETDWRGIVELYDRLFELWPSPVIALNRAVAVGFTEGPSVALELLAAAGIAGELGSYGPYLVARADLLRRAGRLAEARDAFRAAVARAGSAPERRFLERRLESLVP